MYSESPAIPLSIRPAPAGRPTVLRRAAAAALLAACAVAPAAAADGSAPEVRAERPLEALRERADAQRNRLWVLREDGVHIYEMTTRRPIARIALPEWMFVGRSFKCAPDLALDASGAAIVSSNVLATLWRIDPARFEVSRLDLALDTDRDKDVGYTGLAFVDGLLFGVDALHGSLWKIDLAAAKAQKLALSAPLRGACGLAHLRERAQSAPERPLMLCVSGGKGARRIGLSPDLRRGNVTEGSCP